MIYCVEDDANIRELVAYTLQTMGFEAKEIEDMEANAFAAILLAPKERLDEQTDVYNLSYKNISVQTILKIMDIFAIPYKAAVIRLLEEDKIDAKDAKKLLQVTEEEISKQMKLTGKAARWQEIHKDFVRFGSLSELMYDVEQMDAVRDERLSSDKSRLTEIMKNLRKQ